MARSRIHFANIINKRLQFNFCGVVLLLALEYMVLASWCRTWFLRDLDRSLVTHDSATTMLVVFRLISHYSMTFLGLWVVLTLLNFAGMVVMINRVAGPVYRLTLLLRRAGSGESVPPKVAFRKSDYFSDLAEATTQLFDRLKAGRSVEFAAPAAAAPESGEDSPARSSGT